MKAQNFGGIVHDADVVNVRLASGLSGLYVAGNRGLAYDAAVVRRYEATTESWQAVTDAGLPAALRLRGVAIHPNTGQPWISVAIRESVEQYHETYSHRVYRLEGLQWVQVGEPILTDGSVAGGADWKEPGNRVLAFHPVTYVPYVLVDAPEPNKGRLFAHQFDGTSWQALPQISIGHTLDSTLSFFGAGDLAVAYCERYANDTDTDFDGAAPGYGASDRATVKRWDGANWQLVGVSPKDADWLAMAVNPVNGLPWLAYRDSQAGYKITVRRYTGSAWEVVGTAGLGSEYQAESVRLVMSPTGQPYLALIVRDADGIDRITLHTTDGAGQWVRVWGKSGLQTGPTLYDLEYWGEHPPVLAAIHSVDGVSALKTFETVASVSPALAGVGSFQMSAAGALTLGIPPAPDPDPGDPGPGDPGPGGGIPAPHFTAQPTQKNSYGQQYIYTVTADPSLTVTQIEVQIRYTAWTAKASYSQQSAVNWTEYGQSLMRARVLTLDGASPWTLIYQTHAAGPVTVERDLIDQSQVTLTWQSEYLYGGDSWNVINADTGALLKAGIWRAPSTTLTLPTATATNLRIESKMTPESHALTVTVPAVSVLPGATAATALTVSRDPVDFQQVTAQWNGALVDGDSWILLGKVGTGAVFLIGQTTDTQFSFSVLDRWNDCVVTVLPAGNPALKTTATLPAILPDPLPIYTLDSAVQQVDGQVKVIYQPVAVDTLVAYGVRVLDTSTSTTKTFWLHQTPLGDGRLYGFLTLERPRLCRIRPVTAYAGNGVWLQSEDGPEHTISHETDPTSWLFLQLTPKWIAKSALQLQFSKNPVLYQRATLTVSVTLDDQPAPAIVVTPQGFASVILGNVLSPAAGQPPKVLRCTVRVVNPELGADISTTYTETLEPKPAYVPEAGFISAQLIQQAEGNRPDIVQLSWSAETVARIALELPEGPYSSITGQKYRESVLFYADSTENTAFVEDCRRLLPRDGKLHSVRFCARGYRLGQTSDFPVRSDTVRIQAHAPEGVADATAQRLDFEALMPFVQANLAADYAETPHTLREILARLALETLLNQIKHIVAHGGRVQLADFGEFRAVWSQDSGIGLNFKPAERGVRFKASKGFSAGVKRGLVLTDAEALLEQEQEQADEPSDSHQPVAA